mmetsp:Transcript_4227/g.26862  ORF Transcript_4227/g.26862 Transcript_4227/m.26862 type:complete len:342 (-) Transcript_4227:3868-4893(-)
MNSSFMSFMCGSRSNSGWKLSTGLDPFRWFPVSFSSSMVYTLDTWNLTLGPAGVFAIHRYRSLNFLHSKNMQLVHPFISATSLSTCLSSLVSSLTSFLACGSKLSTSVMRCLYRWVMPRAATTSTFSRLRNARVAPPPPPSPPPSFPPPFLLARLSSVSIREPRAPPTTSQASKWRRRARRARFAASRRAWDAHARRGGSEAGARRTRRGATDAEVRWTRRRRRADEVARACVDAACSCDKVRSCLAWTAWRLPSSRMATLRWRVRMRCACSCARSGRSVPRTCCGWWTAQTCPERSCRVRGTWWAGIPSTWWRRKPTCCRKTWMRSRCGRGCGWNADDAS